MDKPLRILYFSINPPHKSMRDWPYIQGLRGRGAEVLECHDMSPGFQKYRNLIRKHRALKNAYDAVLVGHTGTTIVPLIRLISRKPVIFNALSPLYDGMVLEREVHRPYSPRALFIWFLDFISFACSDAILLETNIQKEYVRKHYFMPARKLFRVFTTVDPAQYHPDDSITKQSGFLCVLRGWLTPATGAEYVIEAARILKDEGTRFRLIARGQSLLAIKALIEKYRLSNVEVFEGFHKIEELRQLILSGHVYLGQFSSHPRLEKTIQFKTIEACAFALPYITADLSSNRELLHDGVDCLFVRRCDAQDLADKIRMLKNDPRRRERLAEAAYKLYKTELAPAVIAGQLLEIASSFV